MRQHWSFFSAGQIVFGRGAVSDLGRLASARGLQRAFLITDRQLASLGILDLVATPLSSAGLDLHICDEGEPEPAVAVAVRIAEQARTFSPDVIVGLGGGSNLDLAKIVALLVAHGGEPARYFGFHQVPGPVVPIIALPTTAGTGSEVSHAAVLTDTERQMKVSTLSQYLRPGLALVDPALTDSCPRRVTAESGIDTLTHAIEAFTATDHQHMPGQSWEPQAYEGSHPLGKILAAEAIRLSGAFLARAVNNGTDRQARDSMALAALLAGLAFSSCGVALVHALEYPLGGTLHCSHGAGNGLLLPHVMRFLLPVRCDELASIAEFLGVQRAGQSEQERAEQAIAAVQQLQQQIGIPQRIRDLGGTRDQLPEFAARSFAIERLRATTPRVTSEADLLEILEAAF